MQSLINRFSTALIRSFLFIISLLSFKALYRLAYLLTPICYRLIPKYRKRALSNLKLASTLHLNDEQIVKTAKQSLFHLLLTTLEYGKLYRIKTLSSFVSCENPEITDALLDQGQGVIFFCGHQSNWELLFLDATSRHRGLCIGKPIKNRSLYQFILEIRQKFSGQVVVPKEAYKACMKALKRGELVGIVGDQGMPESSFSYSCLGRQASMTTLPALLALRSKCPLVVATIVRYKGHYRISYSPPLYPHENSQTPVENLTKEALKILDEKIALHPEQWMWQHNRWKIAYAPEVPKSYRHDAILLVIPDSNPSFIADIPELKKLYPGAYFIAFVPEKEWINVKPLDLDELYPYTKTSQCFITHYGPKMIFDGVGIKGLEKHYKKQALFSYLYAPSLKNLIATWKKTYAH